MPILLTCLTMILVLTSVSFAANLAVVDVSPAQHHPSVAIDANIHVLFDRPLDFGTVNRNTVRVCSEAFGFLNFAASQGGSAAELIVDPALDFVAGDVINVTLTRGLKSTHDESLLPPYQWRFRVATEAGTGDLTLDSSYWSYSWPHSLAVADVDGDQDLDIVTTNGDLGTLAAYLNAGNGKFASGPVVTVGTSADGAVVGDWDGDGDMDAAVCIDEVDSVAILDNDGAGNFTVDQRLAPGDKPLTSHAVDINGDGDLDILVACEDDDFLVVLQNSDGTFMLADTLGTNSLPTFVASGDFNGDNAFDLASASYSDDTIDVFLNTGGGVYVLDESYPAGTNNWSTAVADLNGDFRPDIVSAAWQNEITVLLDDGHGGFTSDLDTLDGMPRHAEPGDIDGDGDLDLIVACQLAQAVVVLLNDGVGNFTKDTSYTFNANPDQVATADFNDDGILDVAMVSPPAAGLFVLLGDSEEATCCDIRGDVNHDGEPLIDISDLVYMVNWQFLFGPEPACEDECDLNGSGGVIDISDLVYLVNYMFHGGPDPVPCQ